MIDGECEKGHFGCLIGSEPPLLAERERDFCDFFASPDGLRYNSTHLGTGEYKDVWLVTYRGHKMALRILNEHNINRRFGTTGPHRTEKRERYIRSMKWEGIITRALKAAGSRNIMYEHGACFKGAVSATFGEALIPLDERIWSDVPINDLFVALLDLMRHFQWLEHRRLLYCDLALHQYAYDSRERRFKLVDFDSFLYRWDAAPPFLSDAPCSTAGSEQCQEASHRPHPHCYRRERRSEEDFSCNVTHGHCNGIDFSTQLLVAFERVIRPLMNSLLKQKHLLQCKQDRWQKISNMATSTRRTFRAHWRTLIPSVEKFIETCEFL